MTITLEQRKVQQNFQEKFCQLMSDKKLQLPLREDEDYSQTIKSLFDYYQSQLDFISDKQKNAVKIICDSLIRIIEEDHDTAKLSFERLMNFEILNKNLHIIKDQLPIDGYGRTQMNLFRLRQVTSNRNYKRKDIFHQPKNKFTDQQREPYRYSLEDKPSLYLGSTVYCCYKELGIHAQFPRVIGSVFKVNPEVESSFYVIDLGNRPIDFIKNKNKYKKANMSYNENQYMFVYPLIAACSVVEPGEGHRNILEYKISQLLLRWLVSHHSDQLCGIRYFSCHEAFYEINDKDDHFILERESTTSFTKFFINYVFPIGRQLDNAGYCEQLKHAFFVSQPKYIAEYGTIQKFERSIKVSKNLSNIDDVI